MRNCSCGYDAICLSTECRTLRHWPKDPRARAGPILAWQDATARARCMATKPPPAWLREAITEFYDGCTTVEDYLNAYTMMQDAGMLYHTKEGWHDRNGRHIDLAS